MIQFKPKIKTINQVFKEYLVEQKQRLSPRSYRHYEDALGLSERCFNGYGHLDLDKEENEKLETAMKQDIEFCDLFGVEVLRYGLFAEFLGYFLPRKVIVGDDAAKRICSAIVNFYKWLCSNKLINDEHVKETIKELRECFKNGQEEHDKRIKNISF